MSVLESVRAKLHVSSLFGTDLGDMVRGIRSNKADESRFINECLLAIKEELRSDELPKKARAILKLTYLQMLGYDMSWAAFNMALYCSVKGTLFFRPAEKSAHNSCSDTYNSVEVMSAPKYTLKRVGYLAASQCFHEGTEVMMLCTNLMRKEFSARSQFETALSLNMVSCVCTTDMARDLAADIVSMLNSSRPYVRKRAILALYRVFIKFPESLRPSFPRLKEKLSDPDPSVVACAVNVLCELARKNPKNFLSLAPQFFETLSSQSRNNWMLIKIIKMFAVLIPLERRLAKILLEPLTRMINSTPAMSLLYECVQTCIAGLNAHLPTMKLCIQKLRVFIEDPDQNLKYLGLCALASIMKIRTDEKTGRPVFARAVAEHRDLILGCLEDDDVSIRLRALDLISGMVCQNNLRDIVERLLEFVERAEGSYKEELVSKVVQLCHQSQYQFVTDFEWYLQVLAKLTTVTTCKQGVLLADEFMDVIVRVKVVRPYGVRLMSTLLRDTHLYVNPVEEGVCEVLGAAAWLCAEFSSYILSDAVDLMEAMVLSHASTLPARVQASFMHNVLKLFTSLSSYDAEDDEKEDIVSDIRDSLELLIEKLPVFCESVHLEVQERACFGLEVLRLCRELMDEGTNLCSELAVIFSEQLLPVAKHAQKKVAVPGDLDLDEMLNPDVSEDEDEDYTYGGEDLPGFSAKEWDDIKLGHIDEIVEPTSAHRYRGDNVYYLGEDKEDGDIPVVQLSDDLGELSIRGRRGRRGRRGKSGGRVAETGGRRKKVYKVITQEEMPEGANADEEEVVKEEEDSIFAGISLDAPLREDEALPVAQHHVVVPQSKEELEAAKKKRPRKKVMRKKIEKLVETPSSPSSPGVTPQESPPARKYSPYYLGDTEPSPDEKPAKSKAPKRETKKTARNPVRKTRTKKPEPDKTKTASLIDLGFAADPTPSSNASSPAVSASLAGDTAASIEDILSSPKVPEPGSKKTASDALFEDLAAVPPTQKPPRRASVSKKRAMSGSRPRAYRSLSADECLDLMYELRTNPKEPKKLLVQFVVKSRCAGEIKDISLVFNETLNVKVVKKSDPILSLPEGEQATGHTMFEVADSTSPFKIKGSARYNDTAILDFQLAVPVSAFVRPVVLDRTGLETIFKEKLICSSRSLPTTNISTAGVSVSNCLHVAPVTGCSGGGQVLYGQTLQGFHVALLLKSTGDGSMKVELKCSNGQLGTALLNELASISL